MKYLRILIILYFLISCKSYPTQYEALFQIEKDGRIGFINNKGVVIIQPQFLSAGNFAEGLAPVRLNGTYGYIDVTGKWAIHPQFDYATPFSEGLAIVYKDAVPFYINRKGEKPFESNFQFLGDFKNEKALVKTITGKTGVIDNHGKLFIDTAFADIHPFIQGLSVVEGLKNNPNPGKGQARIYETGVIDSTGRFIIPYGKYERIEDFEDGYFKVDIPANKNDTIEGYSTKTGFTNKSGKLIMAKDHKNNTWISGKMHCGLAKINLYKYWFPEDEGTYYTTIKSYEGFINLKGKIVINDTTFKSVTDFSSDRAFVEIQEDEWKRNYRMINTKGKFVSTLQFNRIDDGGFVNGLAIVQTDPDWKWGVIDTNANFIIKPQFEEIIRAGNYFVFGVRTSNYTPDYPLQYGIATTNGQIILKPVMQEFKRSGFKDSLLLCVIDGKLAYVHEQGKVIWKGSVSNKNSGLENLNIDYMNRGYFYATSAPDKDDAGGFGQSGNIAHNILTGQKFSPKAFSVVVIKDSISTFQEQFNGIKVFVANNTLSPIQFNASDSRLYVKVQALNRKGEWADIEYLPSSWCGNSYHILTLAPNQYWRFTTPGYEGDFKTKLRIVLQYIDPDSKAEKHRERKEITVYSNEYDGSVNPGQFWRKNDYYPANIMDPYTD